MHTSLSALNAAIFILWCHAPQETVSVAVPEDIHSMKHPCWSLMVNNRQHANCWMRLSCQSHVECVSTIQETAPVFPFFHLRSGLIDSLVCLYPYTPMWFAWFSMCSWSVPAHILNSIRTQILSGCFWRSNMRHTGHSQKQMSMQPARSWPTRTFVNGDTCDISLAVFTIEDRALCVVGTHKRTVFACVLKMHQV